MSLKSISEETLKTDYGDNSQPIFILKSNEWDYDIPKDLAFKN